MSATSNNPELQLLESIYAVTEEGNSPALVSQRELANSAGLSLGLTNTLLKRFIERGWIKLLHVNGRKLMYALTPAGMEEIAVRAVDYFARAAQNASLYRRKIDVFIGRLADRGYGRVLLLGPAEIDFLVEYACMKHGIQFFKSAKACMQDMDSQQDSCAGLMAICADGALGDMKKRAGLPSSVPFIKFSQILMNAGGADIA